MGVTTSSNSAATYVPLATSTLGSAQATVTFNSIPSTYTDLVLITGDIINATNLANAYLQFNSDTSGTYSATFMEGSGSSGSGSRNSGQDRLKVLRSYGGDRTMNITNILNYSNNSFYKTILGRYGSGGSSSSTGAAIGMWRSTSTISSITIGIEGGYNFSTGATFTLYGIKAA